MAHQHRPHGPRPATWESNILKLRALEMVLVLFYVESTRRFIIESIQKSDEIFGTDQLSGGKPNAKEGKKVNRVRALLVSEGVITQGESDELFELFEYRHLIAHQVQLLTADIGAHSDLADSHLGELEHGKAKKIPTYDYTAAKRARALKRKIERGMTGRFLVRIDFSELQFETAERAYLAEIERLKARVNSGIAKVNRRIDQTNAAIKAVPKSVKDAAAPQHPRNTRENGSLTPAGVSCVFQLFEAKATPLAVAHMMRISLRSANHWFKKWQARET